jgi:hypothetical protein
MIDEISVAQVAQDGHRLPLRGEDFDAAVKDMRNRFPIYIIAWRLNCGERKVERTLERIKRNRAPASCGNLNGYNQHLSHQETPCEDCAKAHEESLKRQTMKRKPQLCGTQAAYQRHLRRGETPCEDCKRVHRERRKEKYIPKDGVKRELVPCGTRSAYQRHTRNNETPCQPCFEAQREYEKMRRARKGKKG